VFAWRLLRNRLPTTEDNLVRRQVLHHDDWSCVGGCGSFEMTFHLLFDFDIFSNVTSPISVARHLFHTTRYNTQSPSSAWSYGGVTAIYTFFPENNLVSLCLGYLKGKEQHDFKQQTLDPKQLADKVKFMSFLWLKANMHTFAFTYHDGWRHPFHCMSVMV